MIIKFKNKFRERVDKLTYSTIRDKIDDFLFKSDYTTLESGEFVGKFFDEMPIDDLKYYLLNYFETVRLHVDSIDDIILIMRKLK